MRTDPATGDPLLCTPSGTVRGSWREDPDAGRHRVAVFRAVPVAAPFDSGDVLFATPRPAPAWEGTLDCTDTAGRRGLRAAHTATVYCPSGGPGALPVMAWVHGGRFETGHADEPWYDGCALAREGCVVVAMNYRKRFEGFLPLPGPGAQGAEEGADAATFRGVEDLLLGLRWIRDCAGIAGGLDADADRVTLAGQSAGGALVAWLLTDPRATDLFHRAVLMSPGAPRRGWTQRRLTTRLALRAGRGGRTGRGVARAPSVDMLASLTPTQLSASYRRFARMHLTDCAVGVYPLDPGTLRAVPVLVGTMHDEFVRFPLVRQTDGLLRRVLGRGLRLPGTVDARLLAPSMRGLGVPLRHLRAWCRVVGTTAPVHPLGRTVGDRTIRRWASAVAEALAGTGGQVWAYEFRGRPGIPAQHCAELPLLFDRLNVDTTEVEAVCGPDAQHRLGRPGGVGEQFRTTVVDFVHGRDPDWEPFGTPARTARVFDMGGDAQDATTRDPWRAVRTLLGPLY
ncbi:MAG: carboxylesterase family protein [Corynebacterium sp.]|uniref:carboxylesterase family protein n=1 Tax=unclassified Corynebacterium TaxID=2624378 RepID=UPI00264E62FD|nr:carboxylesterase family protein [Corynebacterium sp.]MDN6509551.1 carboxylesterase family protein [Corynebacterium sp.]